jgi:hypothetical protein
MSSPPILTLRLATGENNIAQVAILPVPLQLTNLHIVAICVSTGVILVTFLATLCVQQRKDKLVVIADNAHPEDPERRSESSASGHSIELDDLDICIPEPRYVDSLLTPTPKYCSRLEASFTQPKF